jgi:demethylmenaquinone methyltransferase/2-methoxy-6-polyprenyl-1,4-benzoquinol methylase
MAAGTHVVWDKTRLADPHGQPDKARRVRAMFDAIAPTYERVNRWLSLGRDASWRRRAVAMASLRASDHVLDVACGTGDFARAFASAGPARLVGSDFSQAMLARATACPTARIDWCRADALALPFASGSFDVVSCAFGIRNFQNLNAGLSEFRRVLRTGGRAVILEFTMPSSRIFGGLYRLYFRRVLPRLAAWVSGDRTGAYDYLPHSVETFLDEPALRRELIDAGFARVETRRLTGGIVTVYVAWKDGHADHR